MTVKVAPVFPASAPLTRNPKVPQKYRPVLWEQHLLPTVAENLATLLGIAVGFLPESIVGAPFERRKFPAQSGWALARFRINLLDEQVPAYLLQPLAEALDWGAIGLRRPAATREAPVVGKDGVQLSEAQEMDLAAYHEVCNVVTCGVLARAWRNKLERPLYILLDGVEAVTPEQFPAELEQGSGSSCRRASATASGRLSRSRGSRPSMRSRRSGFLSCRNLWPWRRFGVHRTGERRTKQHGSRVRASGSNEDRGVAT